MSAFMQNCKTKKSITTMILVALLCSCCFCSGKADAAQKAGWQANNPEAAIVGEIQGEMEKRVSDDKSIIIEVKTRTKPFDPSRPGLKIKEIILEGKSATPSKSTTWKAEPIGIGIVGKNNACFYQFPDTLVKGAESMSIPSAGEIKLSREKEGVPAVVTLLKSPTHICLAFRVQRGVTGKLKLHLADSRFPVSFLGEKKE